MKIRFKENFQFEDSELDESEKTFNQESSEKQEQKLDILSEISNNETKINLNKKKYLNLNLKDLYQNLMQTMIDILDDFMERKPLIEIFTKEDRIFYLGILVIFFSFCLYLIDLTS